MMLDGGGVLDWAHAESLVQEHTWIHHLGPFGSGADPQTWDVRLVPAESSDFVVRFDPAAANGVSVESEVPAIGHVVGEAYM